MRTVRLDGPIIHVTDDSNRVIGDLLGYALSLHNVSGRPRAERAEEFAERFSPDGSGMVLPVCGAWRATEPDRTVPGLRKYSQRDLDRKEIWVLSVDRWNSDGHLSCGVAVIEGSELRHLLNEALAQATAQDI